MNHPLKDATLARQSDREKQGRQKNKHRETTCYLVWSGRDEIICSVPSVILSSSTRGQCGHSPQPTHCSFFSPHCFWSIEKARCKLSVTSCGSIYLPLSHRCTILYLHKKAECVCVWVWLVAVLVCLVCTGQRQQGTASAAMNKSSSSATSFFSFSSLCSLFCVCLVLSQILHRCEGDTIKQAFHW